ncbi:MAG: hypothetical protein RIQ81_1686 [Pseudomonadota bacterium]|jgi:hypothetical protein
MQFDLATIRPAQENTLFDRVETLAMFQGLRSRASELAVITARLTDAFSLQQDTAKIAGAGLLPPPVWYSECHVHCGNEKVAMNYRPLLFKLFKTLIDAPGQELDRQDLLAALYPRAGAEEASQQFKLASAHNLVKLASRAREIALKGLNTAGNANTRWFVYDLRRGVWRLREDAKAC